MLTINKSCGRTIFGAQALEEALSLGKIDLDLDLAQHLNV